MCSEQVAQVLMLWPIAVVALIFSSALLFPLFNLAHFIIALETELLFSIICLF